MKKQTSLRFVLAALVAAALVLVTALPASALTVTFVRHGESEGNASGIIDTSVPGPHLTPLGVSQSALVAAALAGNGVAYDAIYTSNMVRTSETAAPFALATGLVPTVLPGFREINAGIFEGSSEDGGLGRLGYGLTPALWMLGARGIPILGSEDGNAFDARVDAALKVIEESGAQNPVVFSHGATIMFWTMMNVDNPDLGLLLRHRLDNTDVVVIEGSAEEGWTLKSWAGVAVGPASFPTKLLVNVRDLVVTPQTAVYNVVRAFSTGDIGKIANAIRNGVGAVVQAPIKFTAAVVRDVVDAVSQAIRPAAPNNVTTTDLAAATSPAAAARIATPQADAPTVEAAEPVAEASAPVKKVRTSRTAKKPVRSTIAPKSADRPDAEPTDSKPADSSPSTEKDAA